MHKLDAGRTKAVPAAVAVPLIEFFWSPAMQTSPLTIVPPQAPAGEMA
jgi:hypothetical protein